MIGTSPSDSLDETCINSSFGQRLWHMDRILLAAAHAEMIAGLRPQAVTHGPLGRKERSDKRSAESSARRHCAGYTLRVLGDDAFVWASGTTALFEARLQAGGSSDATHA